MANFRTVNKAVRAVFPTLDIEVVRGKGYIYFSGIDGFDKVDSIYTHPVGTTDYAVITMCGWHIRDAIEEGRITHLSPGEE